MFEKHVLPPKPKARHTPWMTHVILELMDERREAKGDQIKYRGLDRQIKNARQKAKEKMLNEQCKETEDLERKNSSADACKGRSSQLQKENMYIYQLYRNKIWEHYHSQNDICTEMQKDVFICFINYVKAFNKAQHETPFNYLNNLDVKEKGRELIKNLYSEQTAAVRINNKSGWIEIKPGVR